MNWIEHPSDPKVLYLAWQAPEQFRVRDRWAVGVLRPRLDTEVVELRYLRPGPEFEELNGSRSYDSMLSLGYAGYPAFSLKREVHDDDIVDTFARRLPRRSRPDFAEYRKQFRLAEGIELSDFALLGQTEAKLPSDGFSLVDPLDKEMRYCDLMLEVAGYRHYVDKLSFVPYVGQQVNFVPEPSNERDRNAVQICANGETIGYINRLQAPTFSHWTKCRTLTAEVERLNGRPEHPRAYVFVRVRPSAQRLAA